MALCFLKKKKKKKKKKKGRHPVKTITDADYADDLALLANTLALAESWLCSLEAEGIGLNVSVNKTNFMCFRWGAISTLNCRPLKLVDMFTYFNSSISSTESDLNICLTKVWTAIYRLSIIRKLNLSDKIRFFPSCGCVNITVWMHHIDANKTHGNYTKRLCTILNKSWKQYATKQQLYGQFAIILKTIQDRWTRHVRHCWRSKNALVVFFYGPLHMNMPVLANQQELAYISSVQTLDVV